MMLLSIQFNPRHSEALYNLGNVMLSRGNRVAAMQHYRNALRYAPNDAEVHSNLARALTDENELDDAVMHYQSALEINPE